MSKLRFKVGDKVKLVQINSPSHGQEQHLHKIGTIVDVDAKWVFPYEIDFDIENLYCDSELEPVYEKEEEVVTEEDIVEDIIKLSKRIQRFTQSSINSRETAMILTKLDEARLWAKEFNNLYGHRFGNLK